MCLTQRIQHLLNLKVLMDNEETERALTRITEKLDCLIQTQQQTNLEIRETIAAATALRARLTQDRERRNTREIIPGSGLRKGDRVKVLNPNQGQEEQGTVVGKTRGNFVKLETPDKATIKRLSKNLERLFDQE